MKIELGATATDTVTGFSGIVLGRCEYLTGCTQILLQPKMVEGKDFVESRWFDEPRLRVTGEDPHPLSKDESVRKTGGDKAAPRK